MNLDLAREPARVTSPPQPISLAPVPQPLVKVAIGLGLVLLAVVILTFAAAVVPSLLGYRTISVEATGLAPDIPQGAVIVEEAVPPLQLHPGDVVSFMSDRQPGAVLTHRVVSVTPVSVTVQLRTVPLGTSDRLESSWVIHSAQPVGRMVYWVPFVGTVLGAAGGPYLSWGLIAIGGVLLFAFMRPRQTRPASVAEAE